MKITTFQCDRCHAESIGKNDIGINGVKIVWEYDGCGGRGIDPVNNPSAAADWCLKCRVATGISHPDRKLDVVVEEPQPTLEDLVRQIVQEETES